MTAALGRRLATSREWMRCSIEPGNAPPGVSVLSQPDVQERFGWAPVLAEAMQTATLEPREAIWPTLSRDSQSVTQMLRVVAPTLPTSWPGLTRPSCAHKRVMSGR